MAAVKLLMPIAESIFRPQPQNEGDPEEGEVLHQEVQGASSSGALKFLLRARAGNCQRSDSPKLRHGHNQRDSAQLSEC
jgi:hypothetical protein